MPGQGSTFKFYIKARRSTSVEDVAEKNAAKLHQIQQDAEKSDSKANQAVKDLKDKDYVNVLNRDHSAHQNPVVGDAANADTLHLLVVEDNLLNQKVMAQQLRKAKCVVHVANHGVDALTFLKKTTVGSCSISRSGSD